jgi:hypothetical protein
MWCLCETLVQPPHVTFMWCLCDACVMLVWCLCDACVMLIWYLYDAFCGIYVTILCNKCHSHVGLWAVYLTLVWRSCDPCKIILVHLKNTFLTFMWCLCDACVMFTRKYVKYLYAIHAMLVRWSRDACATFICHFSDAGVTFAGSLFIVSQSAVCVSLLIFFLTTKKWERVKHGHTNIETKHSTT